MGQPLVLTDGGLETVLIFHHHQDLPEFAAFHLLRNDEGRNLLEQYNRQHLDLAAELQTNFILGSPTWRANPDWATKIGYTPDELRQFNELSIRELLTLRDEYQDRIPHLEVSGNLGPRGDGYVATNAMSAAEARDYHATQIQIFADQGADNVTAMTINDVDEAIGIINAAKTAGLPAVASFTVETDGKLPTGQSLREAIEQTDQETGGTADYFMVNCAHPTHFDHIFNDGGDWLHRIHGIRANASTLSHAELDEAEELDDGNPTDLATRLHQLQDSLPNLHILGGCCGTDLRHIRAIGEACRINKS